MRTPTPYAELYAHHRALLLGRAQPVHETEPQCGWWTRTMVPGGPLVPVRIWMHQVTDGSGALTEDEELRCAVLLNDADPSDHWLWVAKNPISEADYHALMDVYEKSGWEGRDHPLLRPREAVDWSRTEVAI